MVIACCGQKGGSGKSTLAIHLACAWAQAGKRTLLVDADPQGTARWFGIRAEQHESIRPVDMDVIGLCSRLHTRLPARAARYERVLLDCPPHDGETQRGALLVADLALLPCGPSAPDAWALSDSIKLIQRAQALRPELAALVVITRKIGRSIVGAQARAALADCGLPIARAEMGFRLAYQTSLLSGHGVTEILPHSTAALEISALWDELEQLFHGKRSTPHGQATARIDISQAPQRNTRAVARGR